MRFLILVITLLQRSIFSFVTPIQISRNFHCHFSGKLSAHQEDDSTVDLDKYFSLNNKESDTKNPEGETTARVLKKRKRKNGYKASDDRDNLPFVVRMTTPDPYTKVEKKKRKANLNTKEDRKKTSRSKSKPPKYANLKVGGVAASIFLNDNDDDSEEELLPILGEFKLDKSTTCGDIVVVGEKTYVVQKARCQYKYAGGKKFEMVRKVLEVKPVLRMVNEAVLQRSLEKTASNISEPPQLE
mmetsp:Transcript_8209/g.12606  ORF Transcript_8209/g.12606 Transcript_8209/m.12606 type:complete len:242 (-) Transcript_8209:72-797(-)